MTCFVAREWRKVMVSWALRLFLLLPAAGLILPVSATALTLFPDEPREIRVVFGGNGDTVVDQITTARFDVVYNVSTGWSGATVLFDDFGTGTNEYSDLSADGNLSFGIAGTPGNVKFEIEDVFTNQAVIQIQGITNTIQDFVISNSTFLLSNPNFVLSRVRFFSFVVDKALAGDGNTNGTLTVTCRGGWPFVYKVLPSLSGMPTTIPGSPAVIPVGGANANTRLDQSSSARFDVGYQVSTTDWSGATILFDNYGTATNESQDLSGFPQVVFGITGTPQNIQFEIEDIFTNRLSATLRAVTNSLRYYAVDLGVAASRGVDTTQIRFMNFVVDHALAGPGRTAGVFGVTSAGLFYEWQVDGQASGSPTVLPGLPDVVPVGGANRHTAVLPLSSSAFAVVYNVTSGWAGATILYDDYSTAPVESGNLSAFGSLVFAVTGQPDRVKVEILDAASHSAYAILKGVADGSTPYYALSTAELTARGVDVSQIRMINFVVDAALASNTALSGRFDVGSGGLGYSYTIVPGTATAPSVLPGEPDVETVGGSNGDTEAELFATNHFVLAFNVATGGFAGASILYDDFGTAPVEFGDLSAMDSITFGLQGSPRNLSLEFVDTHTNKVVVPVAGIQTNLQFFTIPGSYLVDNGLDLSEVTWINVVLDSALAEPGYASGTLDVWIGGLHLPFTVWGSADGTPTVLPNTPDVVTVGGANPDTLLLPLSTSDFAVVYNVTSGWAGATILFDDFGTAPIETADLSGHASLVFRVTGMPDRVNGEFEDGLGGKVAVRLAHVDDASTPYYSIATADLAARGLNVSLVRMISFVVDSAAAGGAPSGRFDVRSGGLGYTYTVLPGAAADPSVLPGLPDVSVVGGANGDTDVEQFATNHFVVTYNVTTGGFAGATILYEDFTTGPVESGDLSGLGEIVFGFQGAPRGLHLEFVDSQTNKVTVPIAGIQAAALSTFRVPAAHLSANGLDLSHVVWINLIVDSTLAGSGNTSGALDVWIAGLFLPFQVWGAGSGTPVLLPDSPDVVTVGGANPDTLVLPVSTSLFGVVYNVASGGWAGATILFDDFGTGPVESGDLSGFSSLVFDVTGAPRKVSFEIEDASSNKTAATLMHVDDASTRYYAIAASELTARGIDLAHVRMMSFVVDAGLAQGAAAGSFWVRTRGGFAYAYTVLPGSPEPLSNLPGHPPVGVVGGANGDTELELFSTNHFRVAYNVTTGGFAGASILYDDYGTGPVESGNLSGLTSVVFGLQGSPRNLNLEFIDAHTNRATIPVSGVSAALQHFAIPSAELTGRGLDLAQVVAINLIVDANLAGAGNTAGAFDAWINGLHMDFQMTRSGAGTLTTLPGSPPVVLLGGANGSTRLINTNSSLIELQYNVVTGFTGATILYDDYGTPEHESGNLSGFGELVFALYGHPARVKVEFVDSSNRPMVAYATRIAATSQFYSVQTAQLTNDTSRISAISFVVDANLAGASAATGRLWIATAGLATPNWVVYPQGAGSPTALPGQPPVVPLGGANTNTVVDQLSGGEIRVGYDVAAGFAGATILYDDYGTPGVETRDLSSLGPITFALNGSPRTVRVEIEDGLGAKAVAHLVTVEAAAQYYALNLAEAALRGVDLAQVRSISFVVDATAATAERLAGSFTVQTAGLAFPNYVYKAADSDGDGIPDDVERQSGMDPDDDGSVDPDNGPDGDLDDDGVANGREFIAGTSLIDPDDYPWIEIQAGRTGAVLHVDGAGRRRYEFQRTDDLRTGVWARVGLTCRALGESAVEIIDPIDPPDFRYYYRVVIGLDDVSALPGTPDAVAVGGGNGDTVVAPLGTREVRVDYNVSTGGYGGATFTFDDYGTVPVETVDLSTFTNLTFGVSGTPASVKFELEDSSGRKIGGTFRHVNSGSNHSYTIHLPLIVTNAPLSGSGFSLAAVRSVSFVVDQASAGSATAYTGSFRVRTWGLNFQAAPPAQADGAATPLPSPAPAPDNLGGGNSTNAFLKIGTTNLFVNYTVSGGGFDGISLRYDDYGTVPFEGGDFSGLTSIVFGAWGEADRIQVEFLDVHDNRVLGFMDETAAPGYFSFRTEDLQGSGLDITAVRFVNFVVTPALAGAAPTGSFTIVTSGYAP